MCNKYTGHTLNELISCRPFQVVQVLCCMKSLKSLLVIAALLAPAAQANLIVNGSFEDNVVAKGNWAWFGADKVNGWEGSNIEIWNQFGGVEAFDGKQLMELNAHGNQTNNSTNTWSIFQSFATTVGQRYQLTFAYRARASSTEQFQVSVANLIQTVQNSDKKNWSMFTGYFTAQQNSTTLTFTSLTKGTVGNFLDDVTVTGLVAPQRQSVPTGPMMPLLALGAALLWWRRRSA